MLKKPLIVLDRDGVINHDSDAFIKNADEWRALPGSLQAISELAAAGYTVAVASNQSGVGRGLFTLETLEDIHHKMQLECEQEGGHLDRIVFCPHHPNDHCDCRKPLPGLLLQLAAHYDCATEDMLIIGDSLRDLEAAWAVNATACLVRTGNGRQTETLLPVKRKTEVFDDLLAAARQVING